MKSRKPRIFVLCALALAAFAACDRPAERSEKGSADEDRSERPRMSQTRAAELRARADAAFARLATAQPARSETRIGLQAWPEDLPTGWPRPAWASVLADSRRPGEGRLLLVDLPLDAAQAQRVFRRELAESGFTTRPDTPGKGSAKLHAQRGDERALLIFIDRNPTTRLEILFPDGGGRVE